MKIFQSGDQGQAFGRIARVRTSDFRRGLSVAVVIACLGFAAGLAAQQSVELNPSHPDTYVVKKGDTLWDISAMFLRDPWYWPEIWYVNPQVRNPHLIYPGDLLTLVYVDGQPRIQLQRGQAGMERLSPRIREEQLTEAVTTIPYAAIAPFLNKGRLLSHDEIDRLPYIVALRDDHLMGATGNDAYVRGDVGVDASYGVVHVGEKLVDPDDGDLLGYEGIYVGDGTIRRGGDPATLLIADSVREALKGDRLVVQDEPLPLDFMPRAPDQAVDGRIIHVVDGVTQIGQYQVVAINRGKQHGLEPGHVLSVWQAGESVPDRQASGLFSRKVQLPDERAGTLMVFKTYDRMSFGLVMRAEGPIHTLDKVRNPT